MAKLNSDEKAAFLESARLIRDRSRDAYRLIKAGNVEDGRAELDEVAHLIQQLKGVANAYKRRSAAKKKLL